MADFPDLNDDGKVTRADVLKGRGVFKRGGKVKKKRYEDGGEIEFESKMGANPQIDDMTRIRAQDYAEEMQRPAPEIETREAPKSKPRLSQRQSLKQNLKQLQK